MLFVIKGSSSPLFETTSTFKKADSDKACFPSFLEKIGRVERASRSVGRAGSSCHAMGWVFFIFMCSLF